MTTKTIKIDPLTRLEGHGEIKLFLDENNKLMDSQVKVVEVRGFERFLIGRPVEEMPLLTPRMCGICQVPHHLCSAKAVDSAFGLEPEDIPPTALKLRKLMLHGSYIHSHVLLLFVKTNHRRIQRTRLLTLPVLRRTLMTNGLN